MGWKIGLGTMLVLAALAGACSSDDDTAEQGSDDSTQEGSTTVPDTERPEGAASTFAALDGGDGPFIGASGPGPDLDDAHPTRIP